MNLSEVSKVLLHAKQTRGLSFAQIGDKLGRDEVWIAALFYGQASLADENELNQLVDVLDLKLTDELIRHSKVRFYNHFRRQTRCSIDFTRFSLSTVFQ